MRIAFTLGAYRLHDFINLGIHQFRRLCGDNNDCPLLVSDDPSPESARIRETAERFGCAYMGARAQRGHFCGDFQALVNSLAFAEATQADIAVKVSQRFIFRKPEAISVLQKIFENPEIKMATPGRPNVTNGNKSFTAFSILTDVVAFRVGAISPQELLTMYRSRIIREKVPWRDFIETTIDELHSNQLAGHTTLIPELTNHTDKADPIYLRRYQNTEAEYRALALSHGFNGSFPTVEWNQLERGAYVCHPTVV